MYYLGIETSCDETSLAVLAPKPEAKKDSFSQYLNSFEVKASIISSQVEIHKKYGGVVPEVGARLHSEQIHAIFEELLDRLIPDKRLDDQLNKFFGELEGVFVTDRPGLKSALRVGVEFAKSLKFFAQQNYNKVIFVEGTDHLHGHLSSCFFGDSNLLESNELIFPHLHLIVSGGNSQILLLKNHADFEIVGATLDDAAGESLDKIGRMLGLPYPGGVWISKIAGLGVNNTKNYPVGMKNDKLAYSFSGLKTSIRGFLENASISGYKFEERLKNEELDKLVNGESDSEKLEFVREVCESAQVVIVQQLINKMRQANNLYLPHSIGLSGGVSANPLLRQEIGKISNTPVLIPHLSLTGDNAVMIALAGLSRKYLTTKINSRSL